MNSCFRNCPETCPKYPASIRIRPDRWKKPTIRRIAAIRKRVGGCPDFGSGCAQNPHHDLHHFGDDPDRLHKCVHGRTWNDQGVMVTPRRTGITFPWPAGNLAGLDRRVSLPKNSPFKINST